MIRSLFSPARVGLVTLLSCLLLALTVLPARAQVAVEMTELQNDTVNVIFTTNWTEVAAHEFAGLEFGDHARAGVRIPFDLCNQTGGTKFFHVRVDLIPNGGMADAVWQSYTKPFSSHASYCTPGLLELFVYRFSDVAGAVTGQFFGTMKGGNLVLAEDGFSSLSANTVHEGLSRGNGYIDVDFDQAWTMKVYVKLSAQSVNLYWRRDNAGWYLE